MPKGADLWGVQAWCVIAGLFLALFAAARPQWGRATEKYVERSRNVVVAIDVSRSMLAEDVRPNRLERTKADVADLIDSLEGDRCALVAFRRTGVVVCPLTTDRGFLRSTLEQLGPDSAPRGETDLGSAIRASLDALDPAADDHNAIILLSDGGDLRGEALANAALAKKRGIPIFTVGIGDPRVGATVPAAQGDRRGVERALRAAGDGRHRRDHARGDLPPLPAPGGGEGAERGGGARRRALPGVPGAGAGPAARRRRALQRPLPPPSGPCSALSL